MFLEPAVALEWDKRKAQNHTQAAFDAGQVYDRIATRHSTQGSRDKQHIEYLLRRLTHVGTHCLPFP
jgi:hypothetical protein